ncbi:MAG: hypothetical protein QOE33_509 [Acidobacteriota bacterium]|nr:hypothetical protein [Acidobacteriota bacterium]
MKQREKKLAIVWEEIQTPDATERLSAAFAMLFGPTSAREPPDEGLDSDDRTAKISSRYTSSYTSASH